MRDRGSRRQWFLVQPQSSHVRLPLSWGTPASSPGPTQTSAPKKPFRAPAGMAGGQVFISNGEGSLEVLVY